MLYEEEASSVSKILGPCWALANAPKLHLFCARRFRFDLTEKEGSECSLGVFHWPGPAL
jgi:hypothetical protein